MYNLNEIRAIPCSDVAQRYGIYLKESHGRLWGKLRQEEKTASFSINTKKNLWYDFGAAKGGSVIDLVAEIEGISSTEAINRLAELYGFDNVKSNGWSPLTDSQYKDIGIQPERATMNFKFDLAIHTEDQLLQWSNKYGMHVKDLALKYPDMYNKMVSKVALEQINVLRNAYLSKLDKYHNINTDHSTKDFLKYTSEQDAIEINRKLDLLQRALIKSKTSVLELKVIPEKDFSQNNIRNVKNNSNMIADEAVKNKMINTYKNLFNDSMADYFTIAMAKALKDINLLITKSNNKFIPIEQIKTIYKSIGEKLDTISNKHSSLLREASNIFNNKDDPNYGQFSEKLDKLSKELITSKTLFNKCGVVIDELKQINNMITNEKIKQKTMDKVNSRDVEMTL